MRQKTLKIKGMNTPRLFIWLLGFLHGRILKTAVIDPKTEVLSSSYVIGKKKLFDEFCSKRAEKLEQDLKGIRTEAFDLLAEEAELRRKLDTDLLNAHPKTIDEIREAKRCAVRRNEYEKNHAKLIKRLGEINEKIQSGEFHAKEEIEANALHLQSVFAAYAHGMFLRPVQPDWIPEIDCGHCMDGYYSTHREDNLQIIHLLKEVYNHE